MALYFSTKLYHILKLERQVIKHITSTTKYFNLICWKCGAERKDLFLCRNCKIIQKPPEDQNYFRIFGFQEKFDIDQLQLTKQFRQLQNIVHPDKFGNKTNKEKTLSEQCSSLLNEAYSCLLSPLKRAEYLLKLRGNAIEEPKMFSEPSFLNEMMHLNEEVEDVRTDPQRLQILNENNKEKLNDLIESINNSFVRNDLMSVKENIVKLKYFISLGDRINNYLREQGITE